MDQRPPSMRMAKTPVPFSRLGLVQSSFSIAVRAVASGGGGQTGSPEMGRSGLPTVTKTRDSQTNLELKIRNLSATPATAEIDYIFIAQKFPVGGTYIWDRGSRPIAVEAGAEITENIQSTAVVQTATTKTDRRYVSSSTGGGYYENYSYQTREGSRPQGWIVRLFVDGKLSRVQTSRSEFDAMAYTLPMQR